MAQSSREFGKGQRKGGMNPLMLFPLLHFLWALLVFRMLEVGLQQQSQMLKTLRVSKAIGSREQVSLVEACYCK